MSILAAPLLAVALFALGGALLVVIERKGNRAGHALLGGLALCAVLGLAVTMARSSDTALGSFAQLASRTAVR